MLKSRGHSTRRACAMIGLQRSTCAYKSRRRDRTALTKKLRELAAERPRFGYRRLCTLLRRGGEHVNKKLVYRLYKAEGLAVRRRARRKHRMSRPLAVFSAIVPNERWAMDFVHDTLANGRKLRTLNLIDTCTRECLAIEVDTSLSGARVTRVLDRVIDRYGIPTAIRIDNGPEFISTALEKWAAERGVRLDFIQPGKPTQNGHVESFNGRFRDECLAQSYFPTLARARVEIELWRVDYNTVRPHSALRGLTPEAFGLIARSKMPPPAEAAAALVERQPLLHPHTHSLKGSLEIH